ncbi:phosphoribosylglycinamide formyltransferase [Corynebacterium otitidis]|uniref:phosphoribosylglycinamide formyltransferase n=1 Tax=Corynebacterium otitidis TaxID=29321 RepID=UPI0006274F4A|nr:phosphoribosylglycinamide formyltransferase [Corynebacterium otitidis]KKO83296.1 phosphoribosylglycinamide formyltransferase [Corynebacterium otitidis]
MTASQPLAVLALASGSGTLVQSILDHAGDDYRVVGLIADRDCPAIERARRVGVPARVVELGGDRDEWNERLGAAIDEAGADLVVSAGFMRVIGPALVERLRGRLINTHPALLPSYPGAHAVRDALADGATVTGTTVHHVDAGVDTGAVIAQRVVPVEPGDDEATLHERIKKAERALIVEVIRAWPRPGRGEN